MGTAFSESECGFTELESDITAGLTGVWRAVHAARVVIVQQSPPVVRRLDNASTRVRLLDGLLDGLIMAIAS
jgi:hypothetical protein